MICSTYCAASSIRITGRRLNPHVVALAVSSFPRQNSRSPPNVRNVTAPGSWNQRLGSNNGRKAGAPHDPDPRTPQPHPVGSGVRQGGFPVGILRSSRTSNHFGASEGSNLPFREPANVSAHRLGRAGSSNTVSSRARGLQGLATHLASGRSIGILLTCPYLRAIAFSSWNNWAEWLP